MCTSTKRTNSFEKAEIVWEVFITVVEFLPSALAAVDLNSGTTTTTQTNKQKMGLAVKRIHLSSRGTGFHSQHPQGG